MSLIQEALKRQQQESEEGQPSQPPTAVASESPVTKSMPVMSGSVLTDESTTLPVGRPPARPPLPPGSRAASSPWLKIGGLALAIIVILAVGWLIATQWSFKTQRAITPSPPADQPADQPAVSTTVAEVPAPQDEPVPAEGLDTIEPTPEPQPPAEAVDVPLVTPAVVSVDPAPEDEELVAVAPRPPAKPPVVVETAIPAPLAWPSLKLTGILTSPGAGESAALINNQLLIVGGQLNGVTLVEIRVDGVTLQYGGETKLLKVGGVLY